jgi:hypothetical protein
MCNSQNFPCTECPRNFNGLDALIRSPNEISSQFEDAFPKFARESLAAQFRFPKRMFKQYEFHSASWCGPRFDPTTLHHPVPANQRGFPDEKNARNPGRLARRIPVCEPNSGRSPALCARITGQSLPAKFGFPSSGRLGERSPEAVRGHVNAHSPEQHRQRHVGQRTLRRTRTGSSRAWPQEISGTA